MKRLELVPADLLRLRFAHSPMAEVVTSALAARNGARSDVWPYARWRTRLDRRTDELDVFWRIVSAPRGGIADFLTPVPRTARPTLEAELADIAATDPDRVAAELDACGIEVDDPAALLPPLVMQIRRYFTLALADLWPRLRAAADNEIAHRLNTAAFPGPERLLDGLHPRMRWNPDALQLDYLKDGESRPWSLDGHPLFLLPTAFTTKAWIMDSTAGRALWYPPRAAGAVFAAAPPPPAPLAALLGATRAAVLTLLTTPSSTGDVAERLGLAPATASHHLTALRDAGLIVGARSGRRLHYRHTDLGERLNSMG
ncbi:ArsR/SmtB family transcription factor [Dactylosporangium sp. CS-033363]|uniref:ArsR/SmtB family transcription factor n=1 Tax=Dactylosporangium sp. CS-033363 TaxID=3239935 RepID=UPI003D8DE54B